MKISKCVIEFDWDDRFNYSLENALGIPISTVSDVLCGD